MPLVLLFPLVSLVIYLIPIMILRRGTYARAQDYFISSERSPPGVILNSSVAYALKMATFGPFFVWGASGDFWPAITYSAFFAFGICVIYILRRPMLEFMENALNVDGSITVHDFIARRHGNDARVRLLACALTVFAVLVLITAEALVLATFLKPVLSDDAVSANVVTCAVVVYVALYTMLSGNSGVMRSAQSQLGFLYLGLFGATALLLYLLVSAQPPMTPHSTFALVFVAACCAAVPLYRRSRYIDTGPIRNRDPQGDASGSETRGARLFRRFEKILNVCVSICAAWVIVVAGMQLYSEGLAASARDSLAALRSGTGLPGIAFAALVLLPLFHPLADITNWQRLAAFAQVSPDIAPSQRPAVFRGIVRIYAVEAALISLFMCVLGAIGALAMAMPGGVDALQVFIRELADEPNEVSAAALSLLLAAGFAIALSTMSSLFSAALCAIRYDVLPSFQPKLGSAQGKEAEEARRRAVMIGGGGYLVTIIAAFLLARAYLQISFTSGEFLGLLFALGCTQLSFVPLLLGPFMGRRSAAAATVKPGWALVILAVGAAVGLLGVTLYASTGREAWLWAAVPACLASGLVLFMLARLGTGKTLPRT